MKHSKSIIIHSSIIRYANTDNHMIAKPREAVHVEKDIITVHVTVPSKSSEHVIEIDRKATVQQLKKEIREASEMSERDQLLRWEDVELQPVVARLATLIPLDVKEIWIVAEVSPKAIARQKLVSLGFTFGSEEMFRAAKEGNVPIVMLQIDGGMDVNVKQYTEGWACLATAADHGHIDLVNALLERGADVNQRMSNNCTALMTASDSGRIEIMKILLDNGADLSAAAKGWTPLMYAAKNNQREAVELLLKRGADINTDNGGLFLLFS